MDIPQSTKLVGVPGYLETWIVAKIPRFVYSVLQRWQRNQAEFPKSFYLLLCPLVEVNGLGGLPPSVKVLTDARLTCRHFTGCHRPYMVALFHGEQADPLCQQTLDQLPWSEAYQVEIEAEEIRLHFFGATEEIDNELPEPKHPKRTVQELLKNGDLFEILA